MQFNMEFQDYLKKRPRVSNRSEIIRKKFENDITYWRLPPSWTTREKCPKKISVGVIKSLSLNSKDVTTNKGMDITIGSNVQQIILRWRSFLWLKWMPTVAICVFHWMILHLQKKWLKCVCSIFVLTHFFIERVDVFQNFHKFEAIEQIICDPNAIAQFA